MKIAILGAGWYGCHIGSIMLQRGHELTIFERGDSIFSGASKKNQNRLHLGFHYPRNFSTRLQSSEGFCWFKEHYPAFLCEVPNNYYAVAKNKSLLDFETYLQIMSASGLDYDLEENTCVPLKNLGGVIRVNEMLIRNDLAEKYFNNILSPYLHLNHSVDFGCRNDLNDFCSNYDYVIDCTWLAANKFTKLEIYFEPCIYFYYKKLIDVDFSLTVMDGDFFSLYPYKGDLYTLTSVAHTPISKSKTYVEALSDIERLCDKGFVSERRSAFVKLVENYYPEFSAHFKYIGVEFSVKTKIRDESAFRGSLLEVDGNYISVFSGKIDTLHVSERQILEVIK